MLEGGGKGLPHLRREIRLGVVRERVVLPARVGEFRLKEELLAREPSVSKRLRQGVTDGLLEIVAALVGRVDATKSRLDGRTDQAGRPVLLPRRPVEKCRNRQ